MRDTETIMRSYLRLHPDVEHIAHFYISMCGVFSIVYQLILNGSPTGITNPYIIIF